MPSRPRYRTCFKVGRGTFISEFHTAPGVDQRLQLCGHIRMRVIKQNKSAKIPEVGAPETAGLRCVRPHRPQQHASSQRGANRSLWARDGRQWMATSRALGREGAGIDGGDCREERPRLPRKDDAKFRKVQTTTRQVSHQMPCPRSCGGIDARLCMRKEMARSCVTLRGGCAVLVPPQRSAPIEASFLGAAAGPAAGPGDSKGKLWNGEIERSPRADFES